MKIFIYIFFSLIFFIPSKSIESYISFKVNNEIITNIDLDTEYRYLIALNNELKKTNKKTLLRLAKESIIKEKIKKNEIQKFYKFKQSEDLLNSIIENYYKKLGMENFNDFKNYLNENNLDLEVVKNKIEIEMLWNKLIGNLYRNQLNINVKLLKEQIEKNFDNNEFVTEFKLSEIIFQITDENNLLAKVNLIKKDIAEQGFKNAANIHSLADSSKFGGEIGWFDEKQLSEKIINIIKKLEIGELSKPFNVPNGYMILKIEDKKQKKIELDKKKLLEQAIIFEKNKQFQQYSIIYYNKIKLNSIISE
jgi:peptidyl-prolyl cis-trans isomerase SurA